MTEQMNKLYLQTVKELDTQAYLTLRLLSHNCHSIPDFLHLLVQTFYTYNKCKTKLK